MREICGVEAVWLKAEGIRVDVRSNLDTKWGEAGHLGFVGAVGDRSTNLQRSTKHMNVADSARET